MGVSGPDAGLPLVSSVYWVSCVDGSACWLVSGMSWGSGLWATSPGGLLCAGSGTPCLGMERSESSGFGGRSLSWGLGGRSPSWGFGGRSKSCGFGGSSPGLGGNSETWGLGWRSPGWSLSGRETFCGVSDPGGDFWNSTGSGGWLGLSTDGWWIVSVLRRTTKDKSRKHKF